MQLEHTQILSEKFSFNKKTKSVNKKSKVKIFLAYSFVLITFFGWSINEYINVSTSNNFSNYETLQETHSLLLDSSQFINDTLSFNKDNINKHFFDLQSNKLLSYSGYENTMKMLFDNKTVEKIRSGYTFSVNTQFNDDFPFVYIIESTNGKKRTSIKVPYQEVWTKDGSSQTINKLATLIFEKNKEQFKIVDISNETSKENFK